MNSLVLALEGKIKNNMPLALMKSIYDYKPAQIKSLPGRLLSYVRRREPGESHVLTPLRFICTLFLSYFSLLSFLRILQQYCSERPKNTIEYDITLTMTRVIFTQRKRPAQQICMKLWQRSDGKVYDKRLIIRSEDYLLEGLKFNRRFAPGVYLGIAPVTLNEETKKIRRGRLIKRPKQNAFKPKAEYALIMKCLNQKWRLDQQLQQCSSGKEVSIKFLAEEVARMHQRLETSPDNRGTPNSISSKLDLNSELFLEALCQLSNGQNNIEKYGWICDLMANVCGDFVELFKRRYQSGYIKRCHGDLKATNLWISPAKTRFFGLKKYPQQLLALDCVDFNPEFSHIDTLSDLAMLAMDIELHAKNGPDRDNDKQYGQRISNYFIFQYLQEMNEQSDDAWPLLQYYMTEKAMVCAYVSILYDEQPELGERYMEIAYEHAKQLAMLPDSPAQAPTSLVS